MNLRRFTRFWRIRFDLWVREISASRNFRLNIPKLSKNTRNMSKLPNMKMRRMTLRMRSWYSYSYKTSGTPNIRFRFPVLDSAEISVPLAAVQISTIICLMGTYQYMKMSRNARKFIFRWTFLRNACLLNYALEPLPLEFDLIPFRTIWKVRGI